MIINIINNKWVPAGEMLPARPGWGTENGTENDENPSKTCSFLMFLVILGTLTLCISELKICQQPSPLPRPQCAKFSLTF